MSHTPIRYSQNFLRDSRLVERLVVESTISHEDVVFEIGPGKGIITDALARRARRVVAIELDGALAERLRHRYAAHPRVTIHTGDVLAHALPEEPYKVFANIPFSHTREIVTKLTEATCPPQDAYLVMQREAAATFCGSPRECLYSVLLKPWFTVEVTHHFRRADFIPAPNVEVVMLRLQKRGPPLIAASERQLFRDFVVYGFVTRQPTIERILRGAFSRRQLQQAMRMCAIPPDATPSAMTFAQWIDLFRYFVCVSSPEARHAIKGSERQLRQHQARLHTIHRTCGDGGQPRVVMRREG
jgi:23S rRNA (adenine-N6)-dimethyltransferase